MSEVRPLPWQRYSRVVQWQDASPWNWLLWFDPTLWSTMRRRCVVCTETKSLEEFSWKNKRQGTRTWRCKPCQSEYAKSHYRQNKERYQQTQLNRRLSLAEEIKNLKSKPCADCGLRFNYWQMDFDHLPEFDKVADIHRLMRSKSAEKIRVEVAKCDVVCANCHRNRTHMRAYASGEAARLST